MLVLLVLFSLHWFLSIFFQSFYMHRYAAHGMFTMSKSWEKTFHVAAFLSQGASYLNPYAYGVMHRMHHAYADTEKDPHSPTYDKNLFAMMWRTKKTFVQITHRRIKIEPQFTLGVPSWPSFEKFAGNWLVRLSWVTLYLVTYTFFANHWWLYLLLPFHILMGPIHGAIINWFAHKFGYRNYLLKNTSTNLFPVDFFMMGEGLHNNHHRHSQSPNFAKKWFEFDPTYPLILLFTKLGIIQLTKNS